MTETQRTRAQRLVDWFHAPVNAARGAMGLSARDYLRQQFSLGMQKALTSAGWPLLPAKRLHSQRLITEPGIAAEGVTRARPPGDEMNCARSKFEHAMEK